MSHEKVVWQCCANKKIDKIMCVKVSHPTMFGLKCLMYTCSMYSLCLMKNKDLIKIETQRYKKYFRKSVSRWRFGIPYQYVHFPTKCSS
jgi:hypothetical protein